MEIVQNTRVNVKNKSLKMWIDSIIIFLLAVLPDNLFMINKEYISSNRLFFVIYSILIFCLLFYFLQKYQGFTFNIILMIYVIIILVGFIYGIVMRNDVRYILQNLIIGVGGLKLGPHDDRYHIFHAGGYGNVSRNFLRGFKMIGFEKIQEFNYKRYTKGLNNKSLNASNVHSRWQKHKVNQILEKFGFLVIGEV